MKRSITIICIIAHFFVKGQMNNRFTANTGSWSNPNCYQSVLGSDLGIAFAGQDGGVFNWKAIQATWNGSYNWTQTDAVINCLISNSIIPIPTLRCYPPHNPAWSSTLACEAAVNSGTSTSSWFPEADSSSWKQMVVAIVNRYKNQVSNWRIETEWATFWCTDSANVKTQLLMNRVKDFVTYERITYNAIKSVQPGTLSTVSFAGIDTRHDRICFADGYTTASGETQYCTNSSVNCLGPNPSNLLQPMSSMTTTSGFKDLKNSTRYLVKNAYYDELDIHSYGRWKYIADVRRWVWDSITQKPLNFLEGGGPYCSLCDTSVDKNMLVRNNSSYVVYYSMLSLATMTAPAATVKRISWHISPEYKSFPQNTAFGDMDLLDSLKINAVQYTKRPSYFTYRFLSRDVFASTSATAVVKVPESQPGLWHYRIDPLGLHVVWFEGSTFNYTVNGTGTLQRWDIPTISSDTAIHYSTTSISGSTIINLTGRVPVFYSLNNININNVGVTGINETFFNNDAIKIYPNPFNNLTKMELPTYYSDMFKDLELRIFDVSGRTIKVISQIQNNEMEINGAEWEAGLYFYTLQSNNKALATGKIIRLR